MISNQRCFFSLNITRVRTSCEWCFSSPMSSSALLKSTRKGDIVIGSRPRIASSPETCYYSFESMPWQNLMILFFFDKTTCFSDEAHFIPHHKIIFLGWYDLSQSECQLSSSFTHKGRCNLFQLECQLSFSSAYKRKAHLSFREFSFFKSSNLHFYYQPRQTLSTMSSFCKQISSAFTKIMDFFGRFILEVYLIIGIGYALFAHFRTRESKRNGMLGQPFHKQDAVSYLR